MAPPRISDEIKQKVIAAKHADPSLSSRALGRSFGVHSSTVLNILSEIQTAPSVAPVRKVVEEPIEHIPEVEPEGNWRYGNSWLFNGDSQTYIIYLKCRTRPLILGADKMQSMKRSYSNWDGQPATINEICRRFAIPRDQFLEMKSVLGWTHDQEPFTAEEVLARPADELAADALQMKRQNVFEEFQKQDWRETKANADKFQNLYQSFILPLYEHIQAFAPTYVPQLVNIRRARSPFAVVTNTGELHHGKSGWVGETGEEYNRAEAESRLIRSRESMLQEVADRGRPEKIIVAVGNDFFNIDNDGNTTTKGTPQDCDGTAARIFVEGLALSVRDIDMLLSVSAVEVVYVPGNHDRLISFALLQSIAAWYRNDPRLTFNLDNKSRCYSSYGSTLLGFAHGDGAMKPKDYMATMAKEASHLWSSTRHRAFFTGHLHTEVVRELTGGTHYQMKSLSGQDRYHARNAYLSTAGTNSYIIDREHGVKAALTWLNSSHTHAA